MKILLVSPYPPVLDGIGKYTQELVRELDGHGHDIKVAIPRPVAGAPPEVVIVVGAPVKGARARLPSGWRPDVVHVQFAVAAYGTRVLALLRWLRTVKDGLGIPVVATMHEAIRDIRSLRIVGRLLYRRLAVLSDAIIVHTNLAKEYLVTSTGTTESKVAVVPHPTMPPPPLAVQTAELRSRFALGACRVLLAFGFIHVDKGLSDLVDALGKAARANPLLFSDVRLVVAGSVRPRTGLFRIFELRDRVHLRRVLRRARGHDIDRNIVLTGYVPDQDVGGWFSMATAAVLPYRRADQSGVASLARAYGTPVLSSDVGGLGEQFAQSNWTFPTRDPSRLADTMTRFLLCDPAAISTTDPAATGSDIRDVAEATVFIYSASCPS